MCVGQERRVAPMIPTAKKGRAPAGRRPPPTSKRIAPITKEPETLTIKVPQGKSGPKRFTIRPPPDSEPQARSLRLKRRIVRSSVDPYQKV